MHSVPSSSSLLCNTRKMAQLGWTAFRSGGAIRSTRRRQTIEECRLRVFQKAESSVRRPGKGAVQSRSGVESVCPFTTSRLSSSVTHFQVVTVKWCLYGPCMWPGYCCDGCLYAIFGDETHFFLPDFFHYLIAIIQLYCLELASMSLYLPRETATSPSACNSTRRPNAQGGKYINPQR